MNQADFPTQVASKEHWMDICATETLLPLSGWNKVIILTCMFYVLYVYSSYEIRIQYMYCQLDAMYCFILYYYHNITGSNYSIFDSLSMNSSTLAYASN